MEMWCLKIVHNLKNEKMKNIIIIILIGFLFMSSTLNCKAQSNFPQDGDNIVNNHINKFVGTWVWTSGNTSLQLVLKKENVKQPYGNNIYADVIIGFHKYTDNGNIIENSTQYSNETFSFSYKGNSTIYGSTEESKPNTLNGGMTHLSKNKNLTFQIEYIDATHIKLVKLKNTAGIKFRKPTDPPFDGTITLPQNIILTKQ